MTAKLHHGNEWVTVESEDGPVTLWLEERNAKGDKTMLMLCAQDGECDHPHEDGDPDAKVPWRVFDRRVSAMLRRKTRVEANISDDLPTDAYLQHNFEEPLVYDPANGELIHTAACGQMTSFDASDIKEAILMFRAMVRRRHLADDSTALTAA